MMTNATQQATTRSKATINAYVAPVLAFGCFLVFGHAFFHSSVPLYTGITLVEALVLIMAVFATLWHGEKVAHWLGEPYGTIVLTMAVTMIEVSIISNLMLDGTDNPALARETLFSAVMLVCNGLVGLCLVYGAFHHYEQRNNLTGTTAYLTVLMAVSVLTLIMPNHVGTPGHSFSPTQLGFVALVSIALYVAFLFVQTVRHPGFFKDDEDHGHEGEKPTRSQGYWHLLWMLVCVASVVAVADRFSSGLEEALRAIGTPDAILGLLIALLVLLPEGLTALIAARANQIQKSLNIALGSALATIGLTIPAVAMISLYTGHELLLGLSERDTVMLLLTLGLCVLSFGSGRTNVLTGFVHLVLFAIYLFFQIVP
jgi:Ca2+:H+ antiporter